MIIKHTSSGKNLPAGFPFSLAASAGEVCFISGMPALKPDGSFEAGTFEEETGLAWHNILAIASAAGYSKSEIVYVQCVLADIDDYATLNDWWRREFDDVSSAPARFTYQAGALPFRAKIEIQAVAARAC